MWNGYGVCSNLASSGEPPASHDHFNHWRTAGLLHIVEGTQIWGWKFLYCCFIRHEIVLFVRKIISLIFIAHQRAQACSACYWYTISVRLSVRHVAMLCPYTHAYIVKIFICLIWAPFKFLRPTGFKVVQGQPSERGRKYTGVEKFAIIDRNRQRYEISHIVTMDHW